MPRKNKGIHSSPATSGEQNMPPNYIEKNKDDTGTIAKKQPLWERAFKNRQDYAGQWDEESLAKEVSDYFKYCYEYEVKPNKAGLRVWINLSRAQYYEWETKPEKYGFKSDIIRRANDLMEDSYIGRIESYPTGNIFLLKTAHGHVETSKMDVTTNGKFVDTEDVNDLVKKLGLDKEKLNE
jgi:hypothetical protein